MGSWCYSTQVGSVNFSSSFDPDAEEPAECKTFYTNMVSITCSENILSADSLTRNKVSVIQPTLCNNYPLYFMCMAYSQMVLFGICGFQNLTEPCHMRQASLLLDPSLMTIQDTLLQVWSILVVQLWAYYGSIQIEIVAYYMYIYIRPSALVFSPIYCSYVHIKLFMLQSERT